MISSGSSNQTIDTTDRPHVNDFSVQTPNRIYIDRVITRRTLTVSYKIWVTHNRPMSVNPH